MRDADVALSLFPLGFGDAEVTAYGEAPLLLTAHATTDPAAYTSKTPYVNLRGNTALDDIITGAKGGHVASHMPQRHLALVSPSSSGASYHDRTTTPVEGVVDLTAAAASDPSMTSVNMHYIAANHLREIQCGIVLARSVASRKQPSVAAATAYSPATASLLEPSCGYVECRGGRRCYYVYPVEDGRYAAAVTLPATVWRRLGGGGDGASYAQWLVHTALRSSVLSADRFMTGDSTTTCAVHPSLHARLLGDPLDVQRSMESQVRLLAKVVAYGTAQPRVFAEREKALRRMCREQPSPLRTLPHLWRQMEQLLRAATSSTDAASLRGAMPTMGLPSTATRYVMVASAVWYRGNPLYCRNSSAVGVIGRPTHAAELLRSAALSAVLEELKCAAEAAIVGRRDIDAAAYARPDDATVRLTAVCLRTRAPSDSEGSAGTDTRVSGYVSLPTQMSPREESNVGHSSVVEIAALPLISLAFTSSSGWTVALLLHAMRVPFLGSPLSSICSGVQLLVGEHFESPGFLNLVREATATMRAAWRRPVTLVSPLMAKLEAAIRDIRVGRRGAVTIAAGAPTRTRDVLLYYYNHYAAAEAAAERKRAAAAASPPSCMPDLLLCAPRQHGAAYKDATSSALLGRCELGEGEALGLDGRQTIHGGGAAVDAVLQAAARYAQLATRVQRCLRSRGTKSHRPGNYGPSPSSLYAQRRCQTVHSVLSDKNTTTVVQAVPHCTSRSGGVVGSSLDYAVTYAVVVLETKKTPAAAHDEYRAFASWLLGKYF
ncbi:hypothetical protein JKF63_05575 [Porcisia hertigi]|uniref:Uncharacterized protein n=1 Tax=Porcisia hertigi TaxID=2761500 RepID=A0A836L8Z6_9TRYP|nr:hypothetical protein JKF63_05575 [Porcisia hertigi]